MLTWVMPLAVVKMVACSFLAALLSAITWVCTSAWAHCAVPKLTKTAAVSDSHLP